MKKLAAVILALSSPLSPPRIAQTTRIGVNLELSGRFATIGTSTLQGSRPRSRRCPTAADFRTLGLRQRHHRRGLGGLRQPLRRRARHRRTGWHLDLHLDPRRERLASRWDHRPLDEFDQPRHDADRRLRLPHGVHRRLPRAWSRRATPTTTSAARSAIVFRQQDDDYSFGLAGFFTEEFLALGGDTIVVDYVANTVDFSAQINDVLGESADVIYYSGFCAEGATLIPALRAAGFAQQILGADASDDSQCPVGGGAAFDGFLFTGFGGPEVLSGEAAERATAFADFFRARNPNASDFNGFTLAGADSMNVVAEAVRRAASSATADVRAALAALANYPGVSGEITYAGTDGTPADRTIAFFQYRVPGSDGSAWNATALFGLGTGD
jgi:hypothetical protein